MLSEYPRQFLSMLSQVLLGGEKVIYQAAAFLSSKFKCYRLQNDQGSLAKCLVSCNPLAKC